MCKIKQAVHVKFYVKDEWYTNWYTCPKCNNSNIFLGASYCPDCGVPINHQSYGEKE